MENLDWKHQHLDNTTSFSSNFFIAYLDRAKLLGKVAYSLGTFWRRRVTKTGNAYFLRAFAILH